jgi:3-methyladenine DNA glycosylase AlkD
MKRGDRTWLKALRDELEANVDPEYRKELIHFFREEIKPHGVRMPVVKKILSKRWGQVKGRPKSEIFELCEELLQSGFSEEKLMAFGLALRLKRHFEPDDFKTFESWLKTYVTTWADCDTLCSQTFGYFLYTYPEFLPKIGKWTSSRNRWVRRGSAVILIYSIRRREHLHAVFEIADLLLLDVDDMVQKGYGWALKEASNTFPDEVFRFVMERRDRMPRTALRYAIEKYPEGQRRQAMRRGAKG